MSTLLRRVRRLQIVIPGLALLALGAASFLPALLASEPGPQTAQRLQRAAATPVPAPVHPDRRDGRAAVAAMDPVVTGSIDTRAVTDKTTASAAFIAALGVLARGEEAAAYQLARALPDDTERRAVQWAAIYNGRGAVDHASVLRFAADAPAFADAGLLRTRMEQALVRADASPEEVIARLGGKMPNTIAAQIALAAAYAEDGQRDRAVGIARAIWTGNFLDRESEALVLKRLGGLLDRDAHWSRAVHLMMHDRAAGVERLMAFLSPAQKTLALARNATSRADPDAKALLDDVDPAYKSHPVYYFSRAQRARQFELWADAVAWLDRAHGDLPDAAEWWEERRLLTRQLLALDKPELAYRAAAGYREGPEGRLVEARFHAGWIALAFLNDAETALGHFEAMRSISTLPNSVTQSNYWLGRAKLALGDKLGSNEAFARAARYSTVYYGQLARAELGLPAVRLRDMPDWQEAAPLFEASEVVRAVRLLAGNGQVDLARQLLRSHALQLEGGPAMLLAARLAQALGAHHIAIQIAEAADRRGTPLDPFSFPKAGLPTVRLAAVDRAAVYAVTRQESHFRADAVSSAGARGLMQLMPATAEETAGKVGLDYSPSRLTSDPAYNALLGSTYLEAQLRRFDGSLVLAAAAYNAGAGNASRWIEAHGDPRAPEVDPVIWVERIPFEETRNYVKRVLGNYLVYRARLGHEEMDPIEALRQIGG